MENLINADHELDDIIEGELGDIEEDDPGSYRPKTFIDKLAFLISAALSPFVLAPIFIVLVVSAFSTGSAEFAMYFGICVLCSTIIPFTNVFLAVKRGKISDVHVAKREERTGPFIVTLLSIIAGILALYFLDAPREIVILGLVMILNGVILFVITLFWKISIHSSAMGCILVSLAVLLNPNYAYGFFLMPLLIWARIRRQRHNIYQGIVATLLSILGTYLLFRLFNFPK